jgi:uncharacterized protein YciI
VSIFAVIRRAGPGWATGGVYDQPAVAEHAAFMNALADESFVLFGGPLARTENGRVRVLLIVNADDEVEIPRRLADDPWVPTERLVTVSIEPWRILVGAEALASADPLSWERGRRTCQSRLRPLDAKRLHPEERAIVEVGAVAEAGPDVPAVHPGRE